MSAQIALGLVLMGLLWFAPLRPLLSSVLFSLAVWVAVLIPVEKSLLLMAGVRLPPSYEYEILVLQIAAAMVTMAFVRVTPKRLLAVSFIGEIGLLWLCHLGIESGWELIVFHLMWFGFLLSLTFRSGAMSRAFVLDSPPIPQAHQEKSRILMDTAIFIGAVILAGAVSVFVLHRQCDSADEWAYTFQAAVFAKGRAYGLAFPCPPAFDSMWVFLKEGRQFSQYTPGWPLFMAPFVWFNAVWLAGPFSLGLLAVGVARLARRAAAGGGTIHDENRQADVAGIIAALLILSSSTLLINGGSRFPHVFVAALFSWAIEALCVVTRPELGALHQWGWGLVLGSTSALMLATRPADGAVLGIGLFLYFIFAWSRRRIAWRSTTSAALAFFFFCGLTLIILRMQLGRWFTTGYSMTAHLYPMYPWFEFKISLPKPNEIKWGIPLATGSYCWWPCSPVSGLAGLLLFRGAARRIALMLGMGTALLFAFYTSTSFCRGFDFGYGPRYVLPAVVSMAVGAGVLFSFLWTRASYASSQLKQLFLYKGPLALVAFGVLAGVVWIAPLVYPPCSTDVTLRNTVSDAIKRSGIRHAVVVVPPSAIYGISVEIPKNYPFELYPNQGVLIAVESSPEVNACVRAQFPDRLFYRAQGRPGTELQLVPS